MAYINDILTNSRATEDHVTSMWKVFEHLNWYNWHVKPKNCALFLEWIELLGNVTTKEGVLVAECSVSTEEKWLIPNKIRDVQVFLGLEKLYIRFIKSSSKISELLTSLVKKRFAFEWIYSLLGLI